MDRDHRWQCTRKAYDAIVGSDWKRTTAAVEFIRKSYVAGITDEFIEPGTIVDANDQPVGPIRDGDSVIFFNFRSDRARQLTRALAFDVFDGFERTVHLKISMTTMTQYDRTFTFPVMFPPQSLTGNYRQPGPRRRITQARRDHLQFRRRRHGGPHRQARRKCGTRSSTNRTPPTHPIRCL
jgi:2,3-bisphosphoglycerate-independent phosphoglycerate mutase